MNPRTPTNLGRTVVPEVGFWIKASSLVPFFPLLACLIVAVAGKRLGKYAHVPIVAGIGLSFFVSLFLWNAANTPGQTIVYEWIQLDDLNLPIIFQVDGLTSLMLSMVTFVATLVAIFAAGYMAGDPAYPRFFACVGLFVFSMTGLVLSANYALTYAFWEGVGVCSYLLVGFWHSKPAAAAAAKKAFLVNRFGDFGFMAALLLLWSATPGHSLNYSDVLNPSNLALIPESTKFWIAIALFWGACAKSAQIPLYVWLPDAMEGPTPVSALIHAATMVTAGVYLVARSTPLIVLAPEAQVVVVVVGCLTAFMAAFFALTQNDLKRVLAYSTISQLGYMFMGLGAGIGKGAAFAVTAGMFHLFTHAFFKALLFLCSGSVMHAMGGVIDMRRFGGLRHKMPWTHLTFAIGAVALAGIPPLAGFWSKDEIFLALKLAPITPAKSARGAGALCTALSPGRRFSPRFSRLFIQAELTSRRSGGPRNCPVPAIPKPLPMQQIRTRRTMLTDTTTPTVTAIRTSDTSLLGLCSFPCSFWQAARSWLV